MLFGEDKTEQVSIDELSVHLNKAFDRKLGNLEARASGVVKELGKSRSQFSDANAKFESLSVEPDVENYYIDTSSVIKSQKGFYCTAVKRIIESWELSNANASNIYEKYAEILSNTEQFLKELLATNNNFKNVLRSYPKYLDSFKRPYTSIEKLTESLKSELSKVEKEFSEYNDINERVQKINLFKEEYGMLNRSINALSAAKDGNDSIEVGETDISSSISLKERELADLNVQISNLAGRINYFTVSLERPSRKFDHISKRKRQLSSFLTDPTGNMKEESDYNEFLALLDELKKSLNSGNIDVKNNLKVEQVISELVSANLYSMANELRSMQGRRTDTQNEITFSKNIIYKLERDKESSKKAIQDKESMKKSAIEVESKIKYTKTTIEGLFLEYYKKRISLLDG